MGVVYILDEPSVGLHPHDIRLLKESVQKLRDHGNTVLLPWDRILCLTQDDTLHLLMDAWGLSDK